MKKRILASVLAATLLVQITGCGSMSITKETSSDIENSSQVTQNSALQPPSQNPDGNISEEGSIEGQNFQAPLGNETEITEAGGWSIKAEDYRIDTSMENVSVVLGYTDVGETSFKQEAADGYELCLVKMAFEKLDSDEEISWDKFVLSDAEGNKYKRMDDTFISDLGMNRMPGTALNFGSYEGWIAFEIKEGAKDLALHYEFANDTYEYQLGK